MLYFKYKHEDKLPTFLLYGNKPVPLRTTGRKFPFVTQHFRRLQTRTLNAVFLQAIQLSN